MINPEIKALGNKQLSAYIDSTSGREQLHASYPDEIEYYACAFELIDSDGGTVRFFYFPVMPSQLDYKKPTPVDIEITQGGIVSNSRPMFIPFDITVAGNFGHRWRKIFDLPVERKKGASVDAEQDAPIIASSKTYGGQYRTGYGHMKLLERIIETATSRQDGNFEPYKLIFYNLSFNTADLVEVIDYSFSQNRESSNQIWNYRLNMKSISPAKGIFANTKNTVRRMTQFARKNKDFQDLATNIDQKMKSVSKLEVAKQILDAQIRKRGLNNKYKNGTYALELLENLSKSPNDFFDIVATREIATNIDKILSRL